MKRLLALLAGAFGLRALLRRRSNPAISYGGSSSPADELRTRLAESRAAEPEPAAAEPEPAPAPPTVDERRSEVHDRARGAIDELRS